MLHSIYQHLITCKEGDCLLVFTENGKVYKIGFDGKNSGAPSISTDVREPIIKVLKITKEEYSNPNLSLIFVSKNGMVKKTEISEFKNVLSSGKVASGLISRQGLEDKLKFVLKTTEDQELFLVASGIQSDQYILNRTVRCPISSFRHQGRAAAGRRGIRLDIKNGQTVVGASTTYEGNVLVTVDSAGYGKFTNIDQFRLFQVISARGISCFKTQDPKRRCIACSLCNLDDDIVIETSSGKIYKRKVRELGRKNPEGEVLGLGRTAVGIKLIRGDLEENETVVFCAKLPEGAIISDTHNK